MQQNHHLSNTDLNETDVNIENYIDANYTQEANKVLLHKSWVVNKWYTNLRNIEDRYVTSVSEECLNESCT